MFMVKNDLIIFQRENLLTNFFGEEYKNKFEKALDTVKTKLILF